MAIIVRLDQVMSNRKIRLLELADKIGITYANLSNLKNGKVTAIRFTTLERICKELNCQPGDILEYLDDEIIEFIDSFVKNEKEKEGAITRLYAYAKIKEEKITLSLAKEYFGLKKEITIDKILYVVSNYYGIDIEDIKSKNKSNKIVTARQLVLYLCRTETNESFKDICEQLNIESAQFMFACDKISEDLKNNENLRNDYQNIIQKLR